MLVTLVICASLIAMCGATFDVDHHRTQRDQNEAGLNIADRVAFVRQKRALSTFVRKGMLALQKLISEATPIVTRSKTTKSYEKRGNYYTALRDLLTVVDPKVVRERRLENGVKIVEGYLGNRKLKLTSPDRLGDTTLDVTEYAIKQPTLGDTMQTQRIIYRMPKQ